jgi:phytoene desaturase
MTKTLVVGAGIGGLAAGLRAKAKGHDVTVIERLSKVGGRAQVFQRGGFIHDAGPTVITAPFMFEELFNLFGKKIGDYVEFRALPTWYEFYFQDGSRFKYTNNLEETLNQIKELEPDDVKGYLALLNLSEKIFDVGFTKLAHIPFLELKTMLQQIPELVKLKSYRTVYGMVSKYIKNEKLRKIFSVHPLLVGGNPFTTTSIYTLIHFLERKWGIHFCMGGTGKLVGALEKLAKEEGVSFIMESDVDEFVCNLDKITAVRTSDGRTHTADNIVFNGDPPYAYRHLLKKSDNELLTGLPRRERFLKYSMGLFVMYFGTKTKYEDVAHHTIWFGPRHKELLKDIFDRHIVPEDFSLYLHRPTATDSSFAPEGCDSFYVLCPVSNLKSKTDWTLKGPELQSAIINALSRTILPGLKENYCECFYMTPEDFKQQYKSTHGAGFSIAPIFSQSAYFRFHNQDSVYKNLFFVGAGTHPGAGLPGVLSSAKVIDSLLN